MLQLLEMIRSISSILIAFVVIVAFPLYAQIPGVSDSDVVVSIVPQSPGPNQNVSVSLNSYITNINSANITWRINGQIRSQGKGEKNFSFNTGAMNTTTTLSITITTSEGETLNKNYTFRPTEIDLIWESDGFTPPFFKGKTLFAHQNNLTVTAIPHIMSGGQRVSSGNLLYTWKRNGSVIENSSGFGKNSISINGSLISRPIEISVEVTHPTSGGRAFKNTVVSPVEPFVAFYKKDPLYGIEYQKALFGNLELTGSREMSVVSVPFLFGTENPEHSNIVYRWNINGVPVQNQSYSQTFRQIEGTSGISVISLTIENSNKILQYANTSFNLSFKED